MTLDFLAAVRRFRERHVSNDYDKLARKLATDLDDAARLKTELELDSRGRSLEYAWVRSAGSRTRRTLATGKGEASRVVN